MGFGPAPFGCAMFASSEGSIALPTPASANAARLPQSAVMYPQQTDPERLVQPAAVDGVSAAFVIPGVSRPPHCR